MATAFVFVKTEPGAVDQTGRALASIQGVVDVHQVFGEHQFVVKVTGPDVGAVGQIIVDEVRRAPGVAGLRTLTAANKPYWPLPAASHRNQTAQRTNRSKDRVKRSR